MTEKVDYAIMAGLVHIDNNHLVDHIHIEYRKNGVTGPWGIRDNNKTTIPQSWMK